METINNDSGIEIIIIVNVDLISNYYVTGSLLSLFLNYYFF